MSRSAESTIKGFLYQFHKTACAVLSADQNENIIIEGIVEDIDINPVCGAPTAIQCKYHEAAQSYVPSLIYKPLLLMAVHDSRNKGEPIQYRIFLYTPGEKPHSRQIKQAELSRARQSKDPKIQQINADIDSTFEENSFLSRTWLEFGPCLDELTKELKDQLSQASVKNADIDSILYPNTIHLIATLATGNTPEQRTISQTELLSRLSKINETAISRWTLAVSDRAKILKATRLQLRKYLQRNSCERYLILVPNQIDQFDEGIVIFIANYLQNYHYKEPHIKTPLFAIDLPLSDIKVLQGRLYTKGIRAHIGVIGNEFNQNEFFREPIIGSNGSSKREREFHVRLLSFSDHADALNSRKSDHLYCIADEMIASVDTSDTMSNVLGISTFDELSFVLNMQDHYE